MKKEETKIFVIYVGILDQDDNIIDINIGEYCNEIYQRIVPESVEGEFILIPTFSQNTRIECINPVYIKNKELINKNEELIKKLNEQLNQQIKE